MKISNYNEKNIHYCGLIQVTFILFIMLKIAATSVTVHPSTYRRTILSFQCYFRRPDRYNFLRRPSRDFSILRQTSSSSSSSSSSSPKPPFNYNSKNSIEDLRIEEILLVYSSISLENSFYSQAESLKQIRPSIGNILSLKREPSM